MSENRQIQAGAAFGTLAGGAAVSLTLSTGCSRSDWVTHQLRGESPRDRMHPANHTSADGLHSVWLCPRSLRLCRLMCGRPLAFRQVRQFDFWAMPNLLGRSPEFIMKRNGSAERFRTSGGIAESRESLLRQSHSGWIARMTRFCKCPSPNPTQTSRWKRNGSQA